MRIGLVSFAWTDQNNGGLRSHVQDLAHDLTNLGADVFIHCVNTDPNAPAFETRSWKEGQLSIHELNYANQQATTLLDFQKVPQAETILREWAFRESLDIAHIHHNLFIGMGATEALSDCCPVVTSLHDYWPLDPLGQLFESGTQKPNTNPDAWENCLSAAWPTVIEKSRQSYHYFNASSKSRSIDQPNLKKSWVTFSQKCLDRSQQLISPSEACASIFRDHEIKQDITIIENGIQSQGIIGRLSRDCQSKDRPEGKIKLAILGNIVPPKGQLQFCKACLRVPYKDEIEISLYGSFPKDYQGHRYPQDELRGLCQAHPNLFFYRGSYDRNQLASIYSQTDIAVVPSLWEEVYGLVAREALCYGLPLITTSAGGLHALSRINTTLILDHQNPEGWAGSLASAYSEGPLLKWVYNRRQGISNSNYIPRTSQDCARDITEIYSRILSQKSNQR